MLLSAQWAGEDVRCSGQAPRRLAAGDLLARVDLALDGLVFIEAVAEVSFAAAPVSVEPSVVPIARAGPTVRLITVQGYGFAQNQPYSCVFQSSSVASPWA